MVLDGIKVIVPKPARQMILETLHLGHPGVNKMYQKAAQFYYWPNMNKEIGDFVKFCERCQEVAPSKVKTPIKSESASHPMSDMGIDLFHWAGKTYVVMADRYSGFLFVEQLRRTDTEEILNFMRKIFLKFGFPRQLEVTEAHNSGANSQSFAKNATLGMNKALLFVRVVTALLSRR